MIYETAIRKFYHTLPTSRTTIRGLHVPNKFLLGKSGASVLHIMTPTRRNNVRDAKRCLDLPHLRNLAAKTTGWYNQIRKRYSTSIFERFSYIKGRQISFVLVPQTPHTTPVETFVKSILSCILFPSSQTYEA